jgi:hypothetical protein
MRTLTIVAAAVSTLVISATCGPAHEDPAPHVTPVPGVELCDEACARMAVVGPDGGSCEEALPVELPDGGSMTCVEFCVYEHDNGVYWNTECLTAINECAEIESSCNLPPP